MTPKDWFDVTDRKYGAKPNQYGVDPNNPATIPEDSSSAIQNAINDAIDKGGGTVYFPAGLYRINKTLHLEGKPKRPKVPIARGVILQGSGRAFEEGRGAAPNGTFLAWGGRSSEPMLIIRSASAGEINDIGFQAAHEILIPLDAASTKGSASVCLQIRHTGGGDASIYGWIIRGCSFGNARLYNVLIGELEPEDPGTGDIQNIAFIGCLFNKSDRIKKSRRKISGGKNKPIREYDQFEDFSPPTIAHIRQRSRNTYGTAFYSCRFVGTRDGGKDVEKPDAGYYPLHAVSIQEGTMDFYSIVSSSMGSCDIFMDSSYCGITVNSWHSESKNFLMARIHPNKSFGQLPIVLSGVSHTKDFKRPPIVSKEVYDMPPRILPDDPRPVAPPYSFSIDWEYIGRGALVLLGCRFSRDIIIRNKESVVFTQGVLFDETPALRPDGSSARPYGIIGNLQNVSGTWFGNEPTDPVNTPPHIIRHH